MVFANPKGSPERWSLYAVDEFAGKMSSLHNALSGSGSGIIVGDSMAKHSVVYRITTKGKRRMNEGCWDLPGFINNSGGLLVGLWHTVMSLLFLVKCEERDNKPAQIIQKKFSFVSTTLTISTTHWPM